MRKQLILSPLLPILALIVYIADSYLFNSLFDFDPQDESLIFKIHFVDPLNFLTAFFSYHFLSTALPILLVVLLFTLRRQLNLKNIGNILAITTLAFIITELLFFFIIPLRTLYLTEFHNNTLFIALLMNYSMFQPLIFITCWALCCHIIFTKAKDTENITFTPETNRYLTTVFYTLLTIITLVSYLEYSVFKPAYRAETGFQNYLIIIVAAGFFYLYFWSQAYLKQTTANNYPYNTIKAYAMTIGLHILLSNLFFLFILVAKLITRRYPNIYDFLLQTYWLWTFVLIAYAIFLITCIGKTNKNKVYQIIHSLIFITLSGFILYIGYLIQSLKAALIAYAILMCFIAFIVWVNGLFVKIAIIRSFNTKKPA